MKAWINTKDIQRKVEEADQILSGMIIDMIIRKEIIEMLKSEGKQE